MATYVIVGGVAGGASAAARLRRMDEWAEIIVLERGPYVSFANCGLPYHVGGVIEEREALLVSTPEKLEGEFNIDVRTEHEALSIDPDAKTIVVRDRHAPDGETYTIQYDKLILSPGAKPLVPPIPGLDLDGVFTLRDIPDMDAIEARLAEGNVQHALVVGGGFIGLEMAENLRHRGVRVTLVEMMPQVMMPIDPDMAAALHRHLREQGVRLVLGDGLRMLEHDDPGLRATLASGTEITADLVMLALGVRPESDLARAAGLDLGPRGHIVVNEQMQTSHPDIYAIGDAVQVTHPVTGASTAIPLAGPANRQARIAADHIVGRDVAYRGTMGTSIVKVFDLIVGVTGVNSRELETRGIPFLASITHSQHHVSYYPGATPQSIKLLYGSTDGKLLGAQVVGYEAVDRSVDVLATAITAGMTVYDLEHLELAYAPPFGAAKDPVNIAGYVASNHLRGDTEMISWDELTKLDPESYQVLDVRSDPEWDLGHIPGAIHIESSELRERLGDLSKDKMYVLCCRVGRRAYVTERMLKQQGFRAVNLTGGWDTYSALADSQSLTENAAAESSMGNGSASGGSGPRSNGSSASVGAVPLAAGSPGPSMTLTMEAPAAVSIEAATTLDARGLQCPGPIMAVYKKMQEMEDGQSLRVLATDPGFQRDIAAWAERTGNALLDLKRADRTIEAVVRKGGVEPQAATLDTRALSDAKTMVVFSGDLDKAMAAFIIANGAASMGQRVTLFFTFWGLNILRRDQPPTVSKNLVERMFGWMMPRGAGKLKLSKLNMGGMGTAMMRAVMRSKNVDSLPSLLRAAQENGVRLVACQMTMDIMGIKEEELIDGVEIGGVASMISESDKSGATLFI